MKKVFLAVFMVVLSVCAFANKANKIHKSKTVPQSHSFTYYSSCGTQWTITASCGDCSYIKIILAELAAIQRAEEACFTGDTEFEFVL